MYSIRRLSRRAATSTLLASFAAFSLLSSAVPSASAQSSPTVTISDVAGLVAEGADAQFQVTVHGQHANFTVAYATQDGTALAGSDYTTTAGTLSFPSSANDTTLPIEVRTIDDNVFEPDKTFHVKLDKASSIYNVSKAVGDATIHSDDLLPVITIKDARGTEGDPGSLGGAQELRFEVDVSNPASVDMSVDFATEDITNPDGSLVADGAHGSPGPSLGGDYESYAGRLSWPAGDSSPRAIAVQPRPDTIHEGNERFYLQLSNPENARLGGNGRAVGTLVDDDPLPLISIPSTASILEGDKGGPINQLGLKVSLSNASTEDVPFTYSTANGTARENDYGAVSGATGRIPAGSLSTTVWLTIDGDDRVEGDETFSVILQEPDSSLARVGNATCVVTIVDDDK
ncbi:MAG: hypothetical protein JOZ87_25595 [Chloroflexi bacterium]|nr:hypothetical protein [Chloroflexota bacterium]